MLYRLFLRLLLFLLCTPAFAQLALSEYEPQILVLPVHKRIVDPALQPRIDSMNALIVQGLSMRPDFDTTTLSGQPFNVQLMGKSEYEFPAESPEYFVQIPSIAFGYLAYTFYDRFPNLLILPKNISTAGSLAELREIAAREKFRYVLHFPSVHLYPQNGELFATLGVQLYDSESDALVLASEFTGDFRNPGFTFSCEDSTLECTINNALSQALGEVVRIVSASNKTIQRERALALERTEALRKQFANSSPDPAIGEIIPAADSSINMEICYEGFFDGTRTKFVALFLGGEDQRHKSDKYIRMSDQIFEVPKENRFCAYVVVGVQEQEKWYYKKEDVNVFPDPSADEARDRFINVLQNRNYFRENSTELNPDFWETEYFARIKDLRKDPDWEKYGDNMWEMEERENREYIGMYEIVAEKLKIEHEIADSVAQSLMADRLFSAFYERLISKGTATELHHMNKEVTLIFPADQSVVLNPVLITTPQGKKELRYFVALPATGEVYEWVYFPTMTMEDSAWHYGSEVVGHLSSLTDWNFSFSHLEDKTFWNTYVLAKEGESYKYLRPVQ